MICNIKRVSDLPAILGYNFKKEAKDLAQIIDTQFVPNHLNASADECHRMISMYAGNNFTCAKKFVHININPAPEDWNSGKMTEDVLVHVCRDYLEAMGYGGQPYVTLIHKDKEKERWHAHIVTTCIDIYGRRLPDSFEVLKSIEVARQLEEKYGLYNATSVRVVSEKDIAPIQYTDKDIKRKISDIVSYAKTFQYKDLQGFNAILQMYGIQCKEVVSLTKAGTVKSGLIYYCVNERLERVGRSHKSNTLHGASYRDIATFSDVVDERTKKTVLEALKEAKDFAGFLGSLKKAGICPVIRKGQSGTDIGITFVDTKNRSVSNGSDLDRSLSLSRISSHFDGVDETEELDVSGSVSVDAGLLDMVENFARFFLYQSSKVHDESVRKKKRSR